MIIPVVKDGTQRAGERARCWLVALSWGRAGEEVRSPAQGLFPGRDD